MSEEGGFGCSSSDIKSLSLSLFPVYQRVPRHKQAALHQLRRQHAVGAAVKGHEPLDVLHVLSLGWNLQCVAKPDGYDWQFLSFSEPWTLQRIGKKRKMQKKGTGMHRFLEFFNSINYLQERRGWTMIHFNFTRLGFEVRSPCGSY